MTGDTRDRHAPLVLLLVLLTLLPAACVLWFMNEAVQVQTEARHRTALEGYRAQLRLVRSRVEARWDAQAAQLNGNGNPAQRFERLMVDDKGDGVVMLDGRGSIVFPDRKGHISGRPDVDVERLLTAAEQSEGGTSRTQQITRVAAELNDYTRLMPTMQRLAMMQRLRTLDRNVMLPTQAALELSTEIAERGSLALEPGVFQQTSLRDVWAFTSADGMTVLLFSTGRIESMMHDLLHEVQPSGILFNTFAPDEHADAEAITAGAALPGWQLSFFQPIDQLPFDDAGARRQTLAYMAVAASALAATMLIAVITGSSFRRQLRLAQLKTDLVAAVSHELRTPLASMRVLVEGLLADSQLDETKTREYLHLLASENARLTRLMENFLAFSRLERGRERFVFSAVSPASIVDAAIASIRERIPDGCQLRVEIEPDLPSVRADEGAVVSALINLLDNALKYTTDNKQVVVRVTRADGVESGFSRTAGVAFQVQDNGIGIPAREHRRIFRRFYRVDQRLASATSGVGLGLSIVELIARAHGGSVGVQSAAGKGSTFTLYVPGAMKGRPEARLLPERSTPADKKGRPIPGEEASA